LCPKIVRVMAAAASRPTRAETAKPRGPSLVRLPLLESDRAIVAALRNGERAGGAALYDQYHAHIRRVLVRVLGPDAELKDLVQQVFLEAISSIDRLEDPGALSGWLASIAVFCARAEIRRRTRARWFPLFSPERLPQVAAALATPEVDEAVRATYGALGKLPADERIAFALRFIDGMEVLEVAQMCRVSLATIKRRLKRAEKRFVAMARSSPALSDRLQRSQRWT
jgi:RNA polymerase sigma-70 factor (ECF subfamily)